MTDQSHPEQPPVLSEVEQLRDDLSALQTIVNRVREALGTEEPAPVRESFRIRQMKTRVSDAEYERDRAQQRAEHAEAAIARVTAVRGQWQGRLLPSPAYELLTELHVALDEPTPVAGPAAAEPAAPIVDRPFRTHRQQPEPCPAGCGATSQCPLHARQP